MFYKKVDKQSNRIDIDNYYKLKGEFKMKTKELTLENNVIDEQKCSCCDELIEVLKELINEMHHRREHTVEWHAIKRHEHYVYDTLTDLRRHKEYMLQQGARIFDENDDDLYVEYEVDKNYEGTVILEYNEDTLKE